MVNIQWSEYNNEMSHNYFVHQFVHVYIPAKCMSLQDTCDCNQVIDITFINRFKTKILKKEMNGMHEFMLMLLILVSVVCLQKR